MRLWCRAVDLTRAVSLAVAIVQRRPRRGVLVTTFLLRLHSPEGSEALAAVQTWLLVSRIPTRFSAARTSCRLCVQGKGTFMDEVFYQQVWRRKAQASVRGAWATASRASEYEGIPVVSSTLRSIERTTENFHVARHMAKREAVHRYQPRQKKSASAKRRGHV